mmetsp:Transcript_9388/g.15828  ORF Transcript_9388/g.15828 Transcript_9388/m.15828 type:complete len:98 (-) Transcript_9388:986-1279(-)
MNCLSQGTIMDAQDYLGGWHLAIICQIKPDSENEFIKVNFLEYPKGNRDEWIRKSEVDRLSGAFLNSESIIEKDFDNISKGLRGLREYGAKFRKPTD